MPPFQTFLNEQNLNTLFDNLEWILFFIAPVVMIYIALATLNPLIDLIKGIFKKNDRDDQDYYYDDDY